MAAGSALTFAEEDARRLVVLRACEAGGPPDDALWSPEDARWASRLADETAGAGASDAAWLAERARHAMQRLLPRRPALARVQARRRWGARAWLLAPALGLVLGGAAEVAGGGQRIELLAAPAWVIVAWNLLVYAWIALAALRELVMRGGAAGGSAAGPLRGLAQRALGGAGSAAQAAVQRLTAGTPEQRFAALWAEWTVPLAAGRAALVLHVAAAALALGATAGLYARALVLDYRVGWQSTLLEPPQVHAVLTIAFAPARAVTGIAAPTLPQVAALRSAA
ncbi:MAG: DUF2868 domain-containing protein, partial [Rubrivivax sp.]|nr:DUF2868 domain-containing protein [Rubrivivax sp.]